MCWSHTQMEGLTRDYLLYCYRGYKPQVKLWSQVSVNIIHCAHSGFITDDLTVQEDHGGQTKYLGVCKLPGEERKVFFLNIVRHFVIYGQHHRNCM